MTRTWRDNAREFDALTKQGKDVRLALLVACSVEKLGRGKSAITDLKVPAEQFAKFAGTSGDRVIRHLTAWEKLAERKLVTPAVEMNPDDAGHYDVSNDAVEAFPSVYTAYTQGRVPRPRVNEIAETITSKPEIRQQIVQQMTPVQQADLVKEVMKGNEEVREEVTNQVRPRVEAEIAGRQYRLKEHRDEITKQVGTPLPMAIDSILVGLRKDMQDLHWIVDEQLDQLDTVQRTRLLEVLEQVKETAEHGITTITGATSNGSDAIEGSGRVIRMKQLGQ